MLERDHNTLSTLYTSAVYDDAGRLGDAVRVLRQAGDVTKRIGRGKTVRCTLF